MNLFSINKRRHPIIFVMSFLIYQNMNKHNWNSLKLANLISQKLFYWVFGVYICFIDFIAIPSKYPPNYKHIHTEILFNNNRINIKLLWKFQMQNHLPMKYWNNIFLAEQKNLQHLNFLNCKNKMKFIVLNCRNRRQKSNLLSPDLTIDNGTRML